MGLIDFYKIFVKTYKEYNKDKIAAKKCIDDTKAELLLLADKYKKAKLILEYLQDIYLMLPYEKRTKCVQATIDMFRHGFGCKYNESVITYLEILTKKIKLALDEMNVRYSDGEYSTIPDFYKTSVVDYIEKFKQTYMIDRDYCLANIK